MTEAEFLDQLRTLPLHAGAAGLMDDAARIGDFVFTKDLIVEGVHFLPHDPPADVAWKLVAVNLSDLAAKGATPEGVLLGFPLGDDAWDRAFLAGLREALEAFACPLFGGDTVRGGRTFSLTAIGRSHHAPLRSGAEAGDALWVTGTIGDAGAGLKVARDGLSRSSVTPALSRGPASSCGGSTSGTPGQARGDEQHLVRRYRRPTPRLAEGRALAPLVSAMMDVSDGLLLDALRMAEASGLAVTIDLARVPLSPELRAFDPDPLAAATAGDDYELLFALSPGVATPVPATRIGGFAAGSGLTLTHEGAPMPLPPSLGFRHG